MALDKYRAAEKQKAISFKDPEGKYAKTLNQLQIKFNLRSRTDVIRKLISEGIESENAKQVNEDAKRYNESFRRIVQKRKIVCFWIAGFNLFFLVLHLMYSIFVQ